jgi:hypothetical protein
MKEAGELYGPHSYAEWERRRENDPAAALDLGDTKESARQLAAREPTVVNRFDRLIELVSFLTVMNKRYVLLYRGQGCDHRLLPALLRATWAPSSLGGAHMSIGVDRMHHWNELRTVESIILPILERHGLPRWRHLRKHRAARWAVIQHYELWPTPLLDLTGSLRVAASFAFGFADEPGSRGMLYVLAVPSIRSDLMPLPEDDAAERTHEALTIRLNAVCPPSARRPHLQEGFLLGRYPFDDAQASDVDASDAAALLVARFALVNDDGGFWNDDFPIHTEASLLPEPDPLLDEFRARVMVELGDAGKASVRTS